MPAATRTTRDYRHEDVLHLQILARAIENECLMRYVSHPENTELMAGILGTALDSLEALGDRVAVPKPAPEPAALFAGKTILEPCPAGYHHENSACVPNEYRARIHPERAKPAVPADRLKRASAGRASARR
jgi:hypothetical protein